MIVIPQKNTINAFTPDMTAVASCVDGDIVCFKTQDCFANQIVGETMSMSDIDETNSNPATGPLYIEGAMPGDILKVEILSITLNDSAVIAEIPGEGVTGKRAEKESIKMLHLTPDGLMFKENLYLPVKPMIGVIGTAPESGELSTEDVADNGGNLDCTPLGEGATIYLPVYQEGAMLALGDMHALMGDGEVCVCGAEIGGSAEVRVSIIKDKKIPLPFIVSGEKCMCICSAISLDEAAETATFKMQDFLTENSELSSNESAMLLSIAGDLRISQMVNPHRTCRIEFPMKTLSELGIKMP